MSSFVNLLGAILIVASLFFMYFVFGKVSDTLKQNTRKDLGTWLKLILGSCCLLGLGITGIVLAQGDSVGFAIFGLVIVAGALILLHSLWTHDGRSERDPMSGKIAHYDGDGKVVGYSDKE